jgi:hypothetical protein
LHAHLRNSDSRGTSNRICSMHETTKSDAIELFGLK